TGSPKIRPADRWSPLAPPCRPGDPDALVDACIAFAPRLFASCATLATVAAQAGGLERTSRFGYPALRALRDKDRQTLGEDRAGAGARTYPQVNGFATCPRGTAGQPGLSGLRSRATQVAGGGSADAHGAVVLLTHCGGCEPGRSSPSPGRSRLL